MDYYDTSSYYYPVDESSYYYPQSQIPPYYDSRSYSEDSYSYGYYNYNYNNYLPADSLLSYHHSPSSHCVVYHSVAAPPTPTTVVTAISEPDLDEYDTHPYRGGYDIAQTYGKPLPPTDLICYPPSSSSSLPLLPSSVATPATPESDGEDEDEDDVEDEEEEPAMLAIAAPPIAGNELQEFDEEPAMLAIAAPPTAAQELHESDEDDDEIDEEEEYPVDDEAIEVYSGGDEIQKYPHGYGLEAFDLCENLFGYWPCLSRPKNTSNCDACGRQLPPPPGVDQWARTADYLFGNPDPYREWEDDAGIRVSAYNQMHYQQPMLTMYEHQPGLAVYEHHQAHQYAQDSWFP